MCHPSWAAKGPTGRDELNQGQAGAGGRAESRNAGRAGAALSVSPFSPPGLPQLSAASAAQAQLLPPVTASLEQRKGQDVCWKMLKPHFEMFNSGLEAVLGTHGCTRPPELQGLSSGSL